MTEHLQTVLRERADRADLSPLDVAAITHAGRRQVRRRRAVGVLAGSTTLAVAVGGYAALGTGSQPDPHGRVASEPVAAIPTTGLTWTTGSTLHVGDQTYDLGHPVASYVRTSVGYVYADPDGTVWSAHAGQVDRVGTVSAQDLHLAGDQDGTRVGWVDPSGERPVFTVLDQATGDRLTFPAADGTASGSETGDPATEAVFEAIDGTTGYVRDGASQSVLALDGSGTETTSGSSDGQPDVLAVQDGVQVLGSTDDAPVSVRQPTGDQVFLDSASGGEAQLSPDATYVNVDADHPAVYATDTGARAKPDVDAFFADGFGWLDDRTLAVLALPTKHSDYELLTCTMPEGTCTVVVPHLGNPYSQDAPAGFQLPVGFTLGD